MKSEKNIMLFEEYSTTDKWASDIMRVSIVEEKLEEWDEYEDEKESDSEVPEFDSLLDPSMEGYNKQTYIQYIDDNTLIFWEGWSNLCWEATYDKPIYDGKSKEDVLNHIKTIRFPEIAKELNMKISSFEYWLSESWTEGVDDGYIMKITLTM
jgi:hypothetical protein